MGRNENDSREQVGFIPLFANRLPFPNFKLMIPNFVNLQITTQLLLQMFIFTERCSRQKVAKCEHLMTTFCHKVVKIGSKSPILKLVVLHPGYEWL
jgi:hypothetical protein